MSKKKICGEVVLAIGIDATGIRICTQEHNTDHIHDDPKSAAITRVARPNERFIVLSDGAIILDRASTLKIEYGNWGEVPGCPVEDWATEVSNGDTRQSYWEWVVAREEENEDFENGYLSFGSHFQENTD